MFTGIINHIGTVSAPLAKGTGVVIDSSFAYGDIALGDSIACDGICLTVIDKGMLRGAKPWFFKRWYNYRHRGASCWFAVEISSETLSRTLVGKRWLSGQQGASVNLERSLRLGDTLDGHMVTGHVDGVATLQSITPEGDSYILELQAPSALSPFIAEKGSIALDGISLTVNKVEGDRFWVNIIPHTWKVTTLGHRKAGDGLNLEIDPIARYVARLRQK